MSALGFDDKPPKESKLVAVNTLPWARAEVTKLPAMAGSSQYGLANGEMSIVEVRPLASAHSIAAASIKEVKKGVYQLSNSQYRVEVSDGVITSLYDIAAKR